MRTDPCAVCDIGQECCSQLRGLRVSKQEFARCFEHHRGAVVAKPDGDLIEIHAADGGFCPNWREGACAVYEQRPMECRLFPLSLYVRSQRHRNVSLGFHADVRCPAKAGLRVNDDDARAIILDFAAEAFPGKTVDVSPRGSIERGLKDGLRVASRLIKRGKREALNALRVVATLGERRRRRASCR